MFGDFLVKTLQGLRRGHRGPFPGPGLRHHPGLCPAQRTGRPGLQLLPEPRRDTRLSFEDTDLSLIDGCQLLCFGSLLMTAEPSRTAVEKLGLLRQGAGKITAYDPNWRPPLWKGREEEGVAAMASLMKLADIVKVSDEELALITGERGAGGRRRRPAGRGRLPGGGHPGAQGAALCSPRASTSPEHLRHPGEGHHRLGGQLLRRPAGQGGAKWQTAPGTLTQEELSDFVDFANAAGSTCATKTGAIPRPPHHPGDRGLPEERPPAETVTAPSKNTPARDPSRSPAGVFSSSQGAHLPGHFTMSQRSPGTPPGSPPGEAGSQRCPGAAGW